MTFREYLIKVASMLETEPRWRAGQTFFNVLYAHNADLADQIRGRMTDPFYNDRRIPVFLLLVESEWVDEPKDRSPT